MTLKEHDRELSIEEKIEVVDDWIRKVPETEEVTDIDRDLLGDVLIHFGENFENLEHREDLKFSMNQYSNKDRSSAMRAVWGEEYYEEMRDWMQDWVVNWKEETGYPTPYIVHTRNGEKVRYYNSGPLAFLGRTYSICCRCNVRRVVC